MKCEERSIGQKNEFREIEMKWNKRHLNEREVR
jgi:hypothetical protein